MIYDFSMLHVQLRPQASTSIPMFTRLSQLVEEMVPLFDYHKSHNDPIDCYFLGSDAVAITEMLVLRLN